MSVFERIVRHGNRHRPHGGEFKSSENKIVCQDGFRVSVIAGWGCYSDPREDLQFGYGEVLGPFYAVEVGFPTERPEPWDTWREYADSTQDDPTKTVYGYVPTEMVRALIETHGGEVAA